MTQFSLTREAEAFLDDLAEELSVPPHRYEQAERSYQSLGAWLHRDASSVRSFDSQVYVQGSFRLGTTIRPLDENEEYDVDSVCELRALAKSDLTQAALKQLLGVEVEAYRQSQSMVKPLREGRRCWVLDYADGAQFHMDIVPALPNAAEARVILREKADALQWASTAIVITDRTHPLYQVVTGDWPRSNPKGYARWFQSRMAVILERRKRMLAESARASVEDIPDYKVRTPLQAAVMILKRHRDESYRGRPAELRPISVIITTLAAHAYNGEETTGQALTSILKGMDQFIVWDGNRYQIPNPTDPFENFADKWTEHPERAESFFAWLEKARLDFATAAGFVDRRRIAETVGRGVGQDLADRAARRGQPQSPSGLLRAASVAPPAAGLVFPNRERAPTKPQGFGGPK